MTSPDQNRILHGNVSRSVTRPRGCRAGAASRDPRSARRTAARRSGVARAPSGSGRIGRATASCCRPTCRRMRSGSSRWPPTRACSASGTARCSSPTSSSRPAPPCPDPINAIDIRPRRPSWVGGAFFRFGSRPGRAIIGSHLRDGSVDSDPAAPHCEVGQCAVRPAFIVALCRSVGHDLIPTSPIIGPSCNRILS